MNALLHAPIYRINLFAGLLCAREETPERYGAVMSATAAPDDAAPDDAAPDDDAPETTTDWVRVHEAVLQLGVERASRERDLCRWLLAAARLAVPQRAGYASLHEYAQRALGLKPRQTEERLRVGRALVELPLLDDALRRGELCFSAVRELSRIATAETEQRWGDWAKDHTVRQIEKAVAMRQPGDGPKDRPDPSLVKHHLRFEVRAETLALR